MTDSEEHYRHLERLYLTAPTNAYYRPTIRIGNGTAEIGVEVRPDFFHFAGAVHGAVYFTLLDDAGFFAANSLVRDVMVLTSNFTIHLLRPVTSGQITAKGKILNGGGRQCLAEAHVTDTQGRLVGHGVGTYVRSKIVLPTATSVPPR
ncbi:MAG: PaaI family thioesterase [Nitrospirae bacterium]|nr:PaaI family thioesterase [Nitrospirota bacterium]